MRKVRALLYRQCELAYVRPIVNLYFIQFPHATVYLALPIADENTDGRHLVAQSPRIAHSSFKTAALRCFPQTRLTRISMANVVYARKTEFVSTATMLVWSACDGYAT